ncbi:MAG: hypothetical protein Q9191_005802 [Dirinaria sp. TL-2023a]
MSKVQSATERSPLLGDSSSQVTNLDAEPSEDGRNDAEANQQTPESESPEVLQARKNVKQMLPVLSVGIFLAFLDQSVVAAISEDIGSDLGALRSVSWIATAYFLTMTCSQPLYGKLSDVFGRKPCLLFAYISFGVGSLGCGLTRSMAGLIAARGIGGGGMLIVVTVLLSDLIPLRERGTYQGYLNLIGAVGSTTGGPIAFLWVEARFASAPFTPGHIIFDKALVACYAQGFFGYAGFTALIFYLPTFFQVVIGMTPAGAGAGLIPAAISAVVGTLLGGIILKRIGKFYWLAVVAATAAALTAVPIAVAPSMRHGSVVTIYVASVASFVPQGITVTASLIAIISNVSAADQAVATACSFLFRSLGAAVGVSLVGLVIQEVLGIKLRQNFEPQEADRIIAQAARSLEFIKHLPPDVYIVVKDCYRSGIQSGYIMCVGLLAVSAISVTWWRDKKMSK